MGSFSPFHWLVLWTLGVGLPLGAPPLPEDPALVALAPEECLAYVMSAGMAVPDPKSSNQTEQLLAEPEVRSAAAALDRALRSILVRSAGRNGLPPGISPEDSADLLKLLLTRPLALYVSRVERESGRLVPHGGIAVNCGDDAAKLEAKIEQLAKAAGPRIKHIEISGEKFLASPDGKIVAGFHGKYLLAGTGKGEVEGMIARLQGSPPKWLVQLREQLPVEHVSTVTYANLKAILRFVTPLAGPKAATLLPALGLNNVTTLSSVTGFDQKGCINKTRLGIDGEPEGIFRMADAKPLALADVEPIPQDATFALAFRLSPPQAFDIFRSIVEKVDPPAKERIAAGLAILENHLDLKLEDDVLQPLGDTWRVFDSPSEGGVFTGLTLVVSLKDAQRAAATHAKLLKLWPSPSSEEDDLPMYRPGPPRLETQEFAGKQIYSVDLGPRRAFMAPAWCMTEKELIVALFPQSIKAYLSRPAGFKSLAQTAEVAQAFQGETGPLKLAYCDSRRVFDILYPMVSVWTRALAATQRRMGVDLGAMMPSARAIRDHLSPAVTTVRRTKGGIEIVQQHSLPGGDTALTASLGAGLLLPAISDARSAARRMQSMNQMKQIGLAMHNYAYAHKTFPPAYTVDKDGKPLLSWRVLILPFLGEDPLYKQFHLDEPWDSPHNQNLIARIPIVYKDPSSSVSAAGRTNYLTVRGKKTVFPGERGISFSEIRDGSANTIMTVEVPDAKAVIWTRPDDFEYDQADPKKGLLGMRAGGFIIGLADGSVRFLPSSIRSETLGALFTRDGGEPIDWNELEHQSR